MHIAILSFNHPDLTARCVESTLKHSPIDTIHLLHNGSRCDVVEKLKLRFPDIHHHVLPENKGFTGGANQLLKNVFKLTDWVFFITNDCELVTPVVWPDKAGFYAPKILRRKTNRMDSLGAVFTPMTKRLRHSRREDGRPFVWPRLQYFYVPGTAFFMHRDVFSAVGDFDESLHTYWEDVDFSMRASRLRKHVDVWPHVTLRHGIGKTCHKDKFYTSFLFQRNRDIVSKRWLW